MSDSKDNNTNDSIAVDDLIENLSGEEEFSDYSTDEAGGEQNEEFAAENNNEKRSKKLSLVEDRKEKPKNKKKKKAKIKKEKTDTTILGFRGRFVLGFLLFVLTFTSLLYLNIYLSSRLEELREERIKTLELTTSWEKLISISNRIISSSRLSTESNSWQYFTYDFDYNLNNIISSQLIENESIIKKHNRLYNYVSNILVTLNLDYYIDISMFEEIAYTEGYLAQFKSIKTSWEIGKENLNKIRRGLTNDYIIQLIRTGKPLLVQQTEFNISGEPNKRPELTDLIYDVERFFLFSEPFSIELKNGTLYIERKINNSIKRINLMMSILTAFVSIMALVFTFFLSGFLQRTLITPLTRLIKETDKIGKGDLTGTFKSDARDEMGTLTNTFSNTIGEFRSLIQEVYVTVIVISRILRTLFKSSKDVKESGNAQASTIEQTRGNFEYLNSMIKTISEETTRADKYTSEALEKVKTGIDYIERLEIEMTKIENSSEEITDIIELINDIAEQTELLSLNASIEAARAGEAGKGFSVVASEVKKLAERSTQSANRIYELITNNNKIIQAGVDYSNNTAKALKEIAMANEVSTGIVKTINEEAQNIQQSSNEILGVINYIAEIAQVNLMEIENVSNATQELGKQSVGLQRFVGQFDARPETIKNNQSHIEEILKVKLDEVKKIIKENGETLLPTGEKIKISGEFEEYEAEELKLGNHILTNDNDFVDLISDRVKTSVTFFQKIDDSFIRVATTIKNYDDSRAIGTKIPEDSDLYKKIIENETFFGRIFIVNRWYVSAYGPIFNETGSIIGVINLGVPEEEEFIEETQSEEQK